MKRRAHVRASGVIDPCDQRGMDIEVTPTGDLIACNSTDRLRRTGRGGGAPISRRPLTTFVPPRGWFVQDMLRLDPD